MESLVWILFSLNFTRSIEKWWTITKAICKRKKNGEKIKNIAFIVWNVERCLMSARKQWYYLKQNKIRYANRIFTNFIMKWKRKEKPQELLLMLRIVGIFSLIFALTHHFSLFFPCCSANSLKQKVTQKNTKGN